MGSGTPLRATTESAQGAIRIYRRAARDDTTGRVLIGDYIVLEDGRMLIGLFSDGKMEGYDVKNSSRPNEPDHIVECIRCKKTGC